MSEEFYELTLPNGRVVLANYQSLPLSELRIQELAELNPESGQTTASHKLYSIETAQQISSLLRDNGYCKFTNFMVNDEIEVSIEFDPSEEKLEIDIHIDGVRFIYIRDGSTIDIHILEYDYFLTYKVLNILPSVEVLDLVYGAIIDYISVAPKYVVVDVPGVDECLKK